ncbi:MAG: DeoR/GlpR family DNA-binding transcription regulator [Aestuariivita sp.]|nr:DeoR/GlpR family DNA-binding transcription regulator [Aestuariivita sp.]MCY4202322.1 DeoR/GlpR family DNA-binding transcription regulator [Aestuariivita sp.]MCY4289931.1 DeoR/GlpR family DNA-binding transcription regulator [Aestuariivita sp.]MCY4346766.1 DeoR/GlpR family DNA-binding transcription regulator [Aestuariivita sp.]
MLKNKPKKERRHSDILDALKFHPAKRVNDLARDLEVSVETIRRDLAELDAEGRLRRTYGGAVRISTFEPALAERIDLFVDEREKIVDVAVGLLGDADSLSIGGGATTLRFARSLKALQRKTTVLTASLGIALELASNPLFEVISLPGSVESNEGLVHGPETLRFLSEFRVEVAVIGASAIDHIGVSEALPVAADVYHAMILNADHTIVVADHSKFGKRSLKLILKWNPNCTLVTDKPPEKDILNSLARNQVRIVVCDQ